MTYTLIRKKNNKRMYLRVKDGAVLVTAPSSISKAEVDAFVASHSDWIEKQMKQKSLFETGDTLSLFEKEFTIVRTKSRETYIQDQIIYIGTDVQLWKSFLKQLTQNYLTKRFYRIAEHMGYQNMNLRLGNYTSQWGSCKPSQRRVTLNTNLVFTNLKVIDAVIVHELCHMKYLNHSKDFYNEVYRWMPDYKKVMKSVKHFQIPK